MNENNIMNNVSKANIKGGNEMKNIDYKQENKAVGEEALVLYNRVSSEDVRWGEVRVTPEEGIELITVEDRVEFKRDKRDRLNDRPLIKVGKEMLSAKVAGMQDFLLPEVPVEELKRVLPFAMEGIRQESPYVQTLINKEVRVFDGRIGIKVELKGFGSEVIYASKNQFPDEVFEAPVSDFTHLKPGFITSSGERDGAAGLLAPDASYRKDVKRRGHRTSSFIKGNVFDAKKAAKRIEMGNSGGTKVPLFQGYTYKEDKGVNFDFFGENRVGKRVDFVAEGKETRRVLLLPEDFTMKTLEQTLALKGKSYKLIQELLDRAASDGMGLMDPKFAATVGIKTGFSFRFTPGSKGFMVLYADLKRLLGVDMILFGGSLKVDIMPYLMNNELDFMLLIKARTQDKGRLALSRQVAIRNFGEDNLGEAHAKITELTKAVEALDIPEIEKYFYLGKGPQLETEEAVELEVDEDPMVLDTFNKNRELFLKDGSQRNRLRTYLRKQLLQFQYGKKVLLEDSAWRHMVVDPYSIVHYLRKGKLGVIREVETAKGLVGISRHSGFSFYKGKLIEGEIVLFRSPFLHDKEARKLELGFSCKASRKYYMKNRKFFVGLMIFSLWDMTPEGMSGADFDGDQCIISWSLKIVAHTPQHPLFLDYSVVEGKVIAGAPVKTGRPVDYHFFSDKDKTFLGKKGITWDDQGKFFLPEGLKLTWKVEELLWRASAYINMQGLSPNQVGLLSNASDTVIEYMTTVKNPRKLAKLDRLSLFLASGVRWEVDKPKHGGAFYDVLPFLWAITEGCNNFDQLKGWEKEFDIILVPFFKETDEGCRFLFSETLYLEVPKFARPFNLLTINSLERKMVELNLLVAEQQKAIYKGENADFYHFTSHAKLMIDSAIANKELSDKVLPNMTYASVKRMAGKGTLKANNPMAIIYNLSDAISALNKAFPEKPTYQEQLEHDKEFSRLKGEAFDLFKTVESRLSDSLLFALIYFTLIKGNSNKSRNHDLWILFTLFGRGAMAFFKEAKTLESMTSEGDLAFVLHAKDNSIPVIEGNTFILHRGMMEGYQASRLDATKKNIEGVFKMTHKEETKRGLLVKGTLLSKEEYVFFNDDSMFEEGAVYGQYSPELDEPNEKDLDILEGSMYAKYLMELDEPVLCPSGTPKETTTSLRVVAPEVGEVSDVAVVAEAISSRTDAVDEAEELALDPEYSAWVMERQLEHAECMYAGELPGATVEVVKSRPSVKLKRAKNGVFARRNRFLNHKNRTRLLAESLNVSVELVEVEELSLFDQ